MGLTAEIGSFLAGVSAETVPGDTRAVVRSGFVDCIGVMIAGWDEPVSRIARDVVLGADPRVGAGLAGLTGAAPEVGLAYGVAAHALDFDDVAIGGHPSAVLVPAVLAEGRETGAGGADLIAAYVAGYEVWAELFARFPDSPHAKGWHPSAILGTVAAASAAAVLRGLSDAEAARAVGIACSLAGGLVANFGTMTKPFQVGRAVRSGLLAARLAAAGMTAAPDAVEHPLGLLNAVSKNGDADRAASARLGAAWRILEQGLNLKLYPVCYAAHRSLDAMAALRRDHGLSADDIAAVDVEIGVTQAGMLRNARPQTALDAKFSIEFAMAAMAIAGACGPAQVADGFVRRADVQDFLGRVAVHPIAEKDADDPSFSPFDRVAVTLTDGRVLAAGPVVHPLGHFRNPATPDALWQKFESCAAPSLGPAAARAMFDRLAKLEQAGSVDALLGAVVAAEVA